MTREEVRLEAIAALRELVTSLESEETSVTDVQLSVNPSNYWELKVTGKLEEKV